MCLPPSLVDATFWPVLAERAMQWLQSRAAAPRDAIVLLPSAHLLPLARAAFAARGAWQPRIETPQTLAASLGPPVACPPGQISLDAATDRLAAAALLRRQAWGAAWARRDARGFEQAAAVLADTARALLDAAACVAPDAREAWWAEARSQLGPVAGPGATERLLARVALEWAAATEAFLTDRLFALRPSAWLALRVSGAWPLAESVLGAAMAPALLLDVDAAPDAMPRRWVSPDFEAEAQAAAAAVIEYLNAGQSPIALIAQDRLLVRRARALLERAGVHLADETGWTLSTTRAAARVMGLLRAAAPQAGADARLDWLKSDASESGQPPALLALEARWRSGAGDSAFWQAAQQRLQPLAQAPRQPLADWLAVLQQALRAAPDDRSFDDDEAGRQLLAALRLDGVSQAAAWQAVARDTRFDLEAFTAWVDATLESATYLPPADACAQVVITPLARALLRPFAAVVFPGTDPVRLGATAAPHPLLPEAVARALGLEDAAARREREWRAFGRLLSAPSLTLLRRASEGAESLAASPWVERAAWAAQGAGRPWPAEQAAPLFWQGVAAQPLGRPAPAAAEALPQRLSASAVEALRECPYRFFARSVLRLREVDELDAELEKRDYGSWLHAVLLRFHSTRSRPLTLDDEVARLHAAADELQAEQGLDAAQLLPFRAGFAALAPLYMRWLHQRDKEGFAFEQGEVARRTAPPALGGLQLDGRIDRIDQAPDGRQLLDYKTGSADALKRKLRNPLEDTQLAFYAALMDDGLSALQASYLALDDREGPIEVAHPDVQQSAAELVEGLAGELARLRAGAGLPALGEGAVCETCEARGLCRKDHWSPTP
jgi:ATP-dependent helicase/nuclease subunit B